MIAARGLSSYSRVIRFLSQRNLDTARRSITMASAKTVSLQPNDPGVFHWEEGSKLPGKKASSLLQEDLNKHHVFFNQESFHNHIPHHILTLYALGAPDSVLEKQYAANAGYQRQPLPVDHKVVEALHSGDLTTYRGKEKYYSSFLAFYQDQIEKNGVGAVVNEALFKGDDAADDLLCRLYAGFLHPLIQFGFGIEFNQPAVVAESLAQTAIHDVWIKKFILPCEKAAKESAASPQPSIMDIIEKCRNDEKLRASPHFSDGNKIRDGILARAPEEMIKYASQWQANPADLEKQTAEMINTAIYFTAAAQRPPKAVKFDFFYMHCVTSSIFFSSFLQQKWLSQENKARLLSFKVWNDIALYVSRGSAELLPDEITNYVPKYNARGGGDQWESIFHRVFAYDDDGHAVKFLRAVAHGEKVSEPFEDEPGFLVRGSMFQTIGNMIIDSVEIDGPTWVRSTGFEEAWKDVPDRKANFQL